MSKRADILLVERGLLASRARAQAEIASGNILVDGQVVLKPSQKIASGSKLSFKGDAFPWVSRAADKLLFALSHFQLSLEGRKVLDIGASTGGFTEVALKQGADHVYAVDVGTNQLHVSLRAHPRLTLFEGLNAKDVNAELVGTKVSAIVCDVSFISLSKALPKPLELAEEGCLLIALIKPQFEVGKGNLGRGGIVKEDELHQKVCLDVETWLSSLLGWRVVGLCDSPILGASGNKEFLIAAIKDE